MMEQCKVVTLKITSDFMQSYMYGIAHVKSEGVMTEIIIKCEPEIYSKYSLAEQGKTVLYDELYRYLYGTLCALLLFWKKISTKIQGWDIKSTPMIGVSPTK